MWRPGLVKGQKGVSVLFRGRGGKVLLLYTPEGQHVLHKDGPGLFDEGVHASHEVRAELHCVVAVECILGLVPLPVSHRSRRLLRNRVQDAVLPTPSPGGHVAEVALDNDLTQHLGIQLFYKVRCGMGRCPCGLGSFVPRASTSGRSPHKNAR